MTYDDVSLLKSFHAEESLGYPLLQDQNAAAVDALGIRNKQYETGHRLYGIPHPGVIYIGSDGTIRAKYAVPGYRSRPPFDALLEHITGLVTQQ